MSVRLGISPIGWSNDDLPELGGDIPLDTCLAETSEAGFEGIELGHKFPRDPPLLQSLLGDHELHLVSRWYSGRLLERSVAEELVAIEPHRALLATMGSAVLVYAETSGGIAGTEPGRYRADRAYRMGTGAISASASPSLPTV
jgi:sugar phosphate isomerase/epimerase